MQEHLVAGVRSFSRIVTQRVGALADEYLSRARPLAASRLLWELDQSETDIRAIRARLDLDSGYLSRLLRRLEAEQLIQVERDPDDHRARVVSLTQAGQLERAELDRRSDQQAQSLLAPLDDRQRARLVEAMATVERLLRVGLVEIAVEDPASAEVQFCLRAYYADLDRRFEAGFDPNATSPNAAEEFAEPTSQLLLARLAGDPIGCGVLKFHGTEPAELKRIWVSPSSRGLGVGRRLLGELEARARRGGATTVRLATNRQLIEAISLYRGSGYVEVAAFNDEPYAHHWFEKRLDTP
jgi:DNA-binding MarR family transcriptional regulator/N-acetylglutamate synthase-like GNAT family acetyltransferase